MIKALTLVRGKTLSLPIRWETTNITYAAIASISQAAPVVINTTAAHGAPNGWRAAVVSAKGMKQINATNVPLRDTDYHELTVIDTDSVSMNDVNSADFSAYVSGGYLQYNTPHDLTGYVPRVVVKDKVGGTVLLSTEAAHAPLNLISAAIDLVDKVILVTVDAATTAGLIWKKGVWEVEMVKGAVVDSLIAPSPVAVSDEVAT